jgi:Leucine-rich repeat (LRR) protein
MVKKSKSLVLKSDTQLSLRKAGNLFKITDKILKRVDLPVLDEDSWIDRLIEWADENDLSEKVFPRDKTDIVNLKGLALCEKNLSVLLPEIGKLQNLEKLILYESNITELPVEIGYLLNLKHLALSKNNLSELPPEIGNLSNLKSLSLDHNNLSELPSEIGNLKKIRLLTLAGNQLEELPGDMGKFSSLIYVDFSPYIKFRDSKKRKPQESTKEFLERCGYKLV